LIIQNNTGVLQNCGFCFGRAKPKERKGYVLRGGSWGFLNRPPQGLELLRIFPFVFFWVCYYYYYRSEKAKAAVCIFDTSIDFSFFFPNSGHFGKRK